ncbi:hypothetical protein [Microcoleus sp. herbarium12]|uniref:hypothetical protein n=1 Tax=Microcoleus sp. herbarium12 TaxID=3055437 RepID=UPI002FD40ACD
MASCHYRENGARYFFILADGGSLGRSRRGASQFCICSVSTQELPCLNITEVTGIIETQKARLYALGAIDN